MSIPIRRGPNPREALEAAQAAIGEDMTDIMGQLSAWSDRIPLEGPLPSCVQAEIKRYELLAGQIFIIEDELLPFHIQNNPTESEREQHMAGFLAALAGITNDAL